jgi:5'-phosphate synthase pdxT subunit
MKHIIGVLALQGGFASHAAVLSSLGQEVREVRTAKDLEPCEGLVIPGGESTVLTKLLMKSDTGPAFGGPWEAGPLFLAIAEFIKTKPVMGTCAGLIMLARDSGDERVVPLGALPVTVERNAYGRQTESFIEPIELDLPHGKTKKSAVETTQTTDEQKPFPATFIRAPKIAEVANGVEILARARNAKGSFDPVMVRFKNILGLSFHPELTPADTRVHEYFLTFF